MPDVLHSLKARFIELKATALDQKSALLKVAAATKRLTPNFLRMLRANDGFIGPWCTVRVPHLPLDRSPCGLSVSSGVLAGADLCDWCRLTRLVPCRRVRAPRSRRCTTATQPSRRWRPPPPARSRGSPRPPATTSAVTTLASRPLIRDSERAELAAVLFETHIRVLSCFVHNHLHCSGVGQYSGGPAPGAMFTSASPACTRGTCRIVMTTPSLVDRSSWSTLPKRSTMVPSSWPLLTVS